MLTNESFNTFLKTLEEPPRHVIFVLATTELNKVLPTVLSRCQVIHLKKPSTNTLADQIIDIAKLEEKAISREHALLLAERANGSFRDALVLLDQVLEQSSGKEITDADIQRLGLRASDYLAFEFITALAAKDSDKLFQTLNTVSGDGKNLSEFLNKLLQLMRNVLYVRHAPGLWKAAQEDLSDAHVATIEAWSSQGVVTSDLLARFLRAYEESKRSTIPAIPAELAIIEILSNNNNH